MIHTRIAGHSLASTTSAAQNFHTYVTFDAEFDAGVQICTYLNPSIEFSVKSYISMEILSSGGG